LKTPTHAGPRGPAEPEIPAPSHAERAQTLLRQETIGMLSTSSRRVPGYPFGSLMPYALDGDGCPLLLISSMAMHTQNVRRDARVSLLVVDQAAAGDPLGAGRVTVLADAEEVPDAELEAVRGIYLASHPNARHWVDFGDFAFFRLRAREVYYVGGFGVMGWVSGPEFLEAEADPLAPLAAGILEHMNDDHGEALVLLASHFGGLEPEPAPTEARMTAVDRLGFHLRVRQGERFRGCRIAFLREATTAEAVRKVLVEMVSMARGAS
jgi:putative heme iron utilization protein